MSCSHLQLADLQVDAVRKPYLDECSLCVAQENLYGCLDCSFAFCKEHIELHEASFPSHHLFFHREKTEESHQSSLYCVDCKDEVLHQAPEQIREEISSWTVPPQKIEKNEFSLYDNWPPECPHMHTIADESEVILPKKSCLDCELDTNLWICLACGYTACGREESGGNMHAKLHAANSGHQVAVRCTTLAQSGSQEVWCYECDDMIFFQNLQERLKFLHVDVTCSTPTKRSKTLAEEEQDAYQEIVKDEKEAPTKNVGKGILNIGNSCYLGSALQVLLKSNSMKILLTENHLLQKHISSCDSHGLERECKLCQLIKLTTFFHSESTLPYLSPRMFKQAWCRESIFETLEQQDVDEFLCFFLEGFSQLQKSLSITLPCRIRDEFEICMLHSTKCLECGLISFREEWQWSLHLPLPQHIFDDELNGNFSVKSCSIRECIEATFAPQVEKMTCQKCEKLGELEISKSILKVPNTFFLFIQKYYWNPSTYMICKANVDISCEDLLEEPMELFTKYRTAYCFSEDAMQQFKVYQQKKIIENTESRAKAKESLKDMELADEDMDRALDRFDNDHAKARDFILANPSVPALAKNKRPEVEFFERKAALTGHIVHYGAHANTGHYVAYGRADDEWVEFNDEAVDRTTTSMLEKACLYVIELTE